MRIPPGQAIVWAVSDQVTSLNPQNPDTSETSDTSDLSDTAGTLDLYLTACPPKLIAYGVTPTNKIILAIKSLKSYYKILCDVQTNSRAPNQIPSSKPQVILNREKFRILEFHSQHP